MWSRQSMAPWLRAGNVYWQLSSDAQGSSYLRTSWYMDMGTTSVQLRCLTTLPVIQRGSFSVEFSRLTSQLDVLTACVGHSCRQLVMSRSRGGVVRIWSHGARRACSRTKISQTLNIFNPLMGTFKPQSNGPLCKNTMIGTLTVDGCAVTFGTARRGLGGLRPRPVSSWLYQM